MRELKDGCVASPRGDGDRGAVRGDALVKRGIGNAQNGL
jgi:hypothetical protein